MQNKNKIKCVIVAFTDHLHLLFEHSFGVSLFETEKEKFSSRKLVLADLDTVYYYRNNIVNMLVKSCLVQKGVRHDTQIHVYKRGILTSK